jgi:hypothetical protein
MLLHLEYAIMTKNPQNMHLHMCIYIFKKNLGPTNHLLDVTQTVESEMSSSSSIFACVLIDVVTFLPSSCLAAI